jgi:hypothetical protein
MQRWLMAVATATAIIFSGNASAQYGQDRIDPTPYGFSFRAGGVFAIDDDLNDFADGWFGFGIDYAFTKQYLRDSETFFSVDYITKSSSGEKGTYWPILVVIIDLASSDSVIGGRVGFGLELGERIFAEASLFLSEDNRDGVAATSGGVYLGYRF